MEMYIVLAITLFMMVMFIWNKVPFGVTTMTCCLLLAMFGIVDIPKAFGGFGNKIVVLIAPMLVLSAALGKTSLVMKISSVLNAAKGKRGTVLILVFYAVGMVMAQFIPTTAAISILVIFLLTLDNAGDITPKRLLLPLLGVMVGCKFRFPVGLGATLNGMYEGVIGDHPEYMLSMLDPFKVAIIPMVVLTVRMEADAEGRRNQSGCPEENIHRKTAHRCAGNDCIRSIRSRYATDAVKQVHWQYALSGSGRRRSGSDLH